MVRGGKRRGRPPATRVMSDLEWRRALEELLARHRRRIEALVQAKQKHEPFRQVYIKKTPVKRHTRAGHWRTIVPVRRAPVATKKAA